MREECKSKIFKIISYNYFVQKKLPDQNDEIKGFAPL